MCVGLLDYCRNNCMRGRGSAVTRNLAGEIAAAAAAAGGGGGDRVCIRWNWCQW